MRGWPALAALAMAAALAGQTPGALAETTALEPLTRRDQLLGWEAVGRLDIRREKGGEGSFCTGALIATNLVLTAAHCVFDKQGRPIDPALMTFRAGYLDGNSIAEARVARTVVHPDYQGRSTASPVSAQNVRLDVALLELATPIPAASAAPFGVIAPGKGDTVSVVSYAHDRADSLSWQRECAVLDRGQGLIAMDCDVSFGSSGAPVFDRSGARARIVSIISAGGPTDQGQIAYGMDLPGILRELKGMLATGRPLAVADAGAVAEAEVPATGGAKRLTVGGGSALSGGGGLSGGDRDIGARFVPAKPAN